MRAFYEEAARPNVEPRVVRTKGGAERSKFGTFCFIFGDGIKHFPELNEWNVLLNIQTIWCSGGNPLCFLEN